jgi:GTP-binding protein
MRRIKFIDEVEILCEGGKGGDGCVAFLREKYLPKGGPAGGDGGDGGNVYLIGDERLNTLADFQYQYHYKAKNGENGKGKNQHGKKGKDIFLKVPLGTDVYKYEEEKGYTYLGSILKPNEILLVAKGGKGGRGNTHFKSPTNQRPRYAEKGKEGERVKLKLVLRLLADVGFVGLPNAGKSTLLKAISDAKPKIAPYPFTTLTPNLGVLESDYFKITACDLPGIIKGASAGKGLGLRFLRHIERCKMILFILDITQNPVEDFQILYSEIEKYNPELLKKTLGIVINKIDLVSELPSFSFSYPTFYISALKKINIEKLIAFIKEKLVNAG